MNNSAVPSHTFLHFFRTYKGKGKKNSLFIFLLFFS